MVSLRKFGALASPLCLLVLLTACGKDNQPISTIDSDGQPVTEQLETLGPDSDPVPAAPPLALDSEELSRVSDSLLVDTGGKGGYTLPDFDPRWGLSRQVYDRAILIMDTKTRHFSNQRYVVLIDFSKHSSAKRFFLFDLVTGKMERHNVAHGQNSDPNASGYARSFSNQGGSLKSALGAYKTLGTYSGKHGTQLRLTGLESTNSASLSRGIVIHAANYVSDSASRAGRSWGCPALDPRVSASVISRVKNGALVLVWK
jgi:hypothetical protein